MQYNICSVFTRCRIKIENLSLFLASSMPKGWFDSPINQIHRTKPLWIDFNDLQQKLYICYSTGKFLIHLK